MHMLTIIHMLQYSFRQYEQYFRLSVWSAYTFTCALFWFLCLLLAVSAPGRLAAQETDWRKMERRMRDALRTAQVPGAVALVLKDGRPVFSYAHGQMNEKGDKMTEDALFRAGGLGRPVAALAALCLASEGKLDLEAPLARYLPQAEGKKVARSFTDSAYFQMPSMRIVEPDRPLLVRDLLQGTAGMVYGSDFPGAAGEMWSAMRIRSFRTLPEVAEAVLHFPLAFSPGAAWAEGYEADLLGYLITKQTGQTLHRWLSARVLTPLQMNASGFYLPGQEHRVATLAQRVPNTSRWQYVRTGWELRTGPYPAWAYGTAQDTLPDAIGENMLLTAADAARLFSALPAIPENIISSEWAARLKTPAIAQIEHMPGVAYTNGLYLITDPEKAGLPFSAGTVFQMGAWGTYAWSDPVRKLTGVLLMQVSTPPADLFKTFAELVYEQDRP